MANGAVLVFYKQHDLLIILVLIVLLQSIVDLNDDIGDLLDAVVEHASGSVERRPRLKHLRPVLLLVEVQGRLVDVLALLVDYVRVVHLILFLGGWPWSVAVAELLCDDLLLVDVELQRAINVVAFDTRRGLGFVLYRRIFFVPAIPELSSLLHLVVLWLGFADCRL